MKLFDFSVRGRSVLAWSAIGFLTTVSMANAQVPRIEQLPVFFAGDNDVLKLVGAMEGSFLGVGVAEIDADRGKRLNLKEERGVEVTRVEHDSPAEKAGLKVGDVVLQYNGTAVEGTEQFVRLVRETPSGRVARLVVSRNGSEQTIAATIGTRKRMGRVEVLRAMPPMEFPSIQVPDVPKAFMTWRSGRLGIEAESVDSQLAEFFGVKEGVLVRSVMSGSPAQKAGIKAGDVVVKIGDSAVTSPREITSILHGIGDRKTIAVTLIREKREMNLTVTLDEDRSDYEPPRGVSVGNKTKL